MNSLKIQFPKYFLFVTLSLFGYLNQVKAFELVKNNSFATVYLSETEPECVKLAVNDLVSDVQKITGKKMEVVHSLKGILLGLGARFGLFFGLEHKTYDYREAAAAYKAKSGRRFVELAVEKKLYFHDYGDGLTPMHSGITAAHDKPILDKTLNILDGVFAQMSREGF